MKPSPMKKSMIAALCAALCIVLPQAMSVIPGAEGIYGLLHMPVLLCAFACGSGSGIVCAIVGVSLSAIITGVPTVMFLPVTLAECIICALVTGLFKRICGFENPGRDTAVCFALGIIIGRLGAAAVSALLFGLDGTGLFIWTGGFFVSGMPGIIIQLVLLQIIVKALSNAGLISLKD